MVLSVCSLLAATHPSRHKHNNQINSSHSCHCELCKQFKLAVSFEIYFILFRFDMEQCNNECFVHKYLYLDR